MRRLIIAAVSLSLSLAGFMGAALAQDKGVQDISTNADGAYVTSTAGLNPTANGEGGTIIYGDINTGPESTVIGPPSVVQTSPPPAAAPAPAPVEPAAESVATDTAAESDAETAAATASDLDADNYPDALEWDLGLDPNNVDTDADGVADGDELNIYGTEPTLVDTDGDGVSDGEELFGSRTDPLVWDDFSAAATQTVSQDAVPVQTFEQSENQSVTLAQETTESMTATDGNASALGPGNASAAPGTVRRGESSGIALLGPDGTYTVTETAPPDITVAGDTEVLAPAAVPAAAPAAIADCGSYGSWYDAQLAYEAAGLTDADPALVSALDPDGDGIACEEVM
jgi:hypothetical protein